MRVYFERSREPESDVIRTQLQETDCKIIPPTPGLSRRDRDRSLCSESCHSSKAGRSSSRSGCVKAQTDGVFQGSSCRAQWSQSRSAAHLQPDRATLKGSSQLLSLIWRRECETVRRHARQAWPDEVCQIAHDCGTAHGSLFEPPIGRRSDQPDNSEPPEFSRA